MFSCDYNGWADVPEDEREAIEAFEAALPVAPPLPLPLVIRVPVYPVASYPTRKAA